MKRASHKLSTKEYKQNLLYKTHYWHDILSFFKERVKLEAEKKTNYKRILEAQKSVQIIWFQVRFLFLIAFSFYETFQMCQKTRSTESRKSSPLTWAPLLLRCTIQFWNQNKDVPYLKGCLLFNVVPCKWNMVAIPLQIFLACNRFM